MHKVNLNQQTEEEWQPVKMLTQVCHTLPMNSINNIWTTAHLIREIKLDMD